MAWLDCQEGWRQAAHRGLGAVAEGSGRGGDGVVMLARPLAQALLGSGGRY